MLEISHAILPSILWIYTFIWVEWPSNCMKVTESIHKYGFGDKHMDKWDEYNIITWL